MSQEISEIDVTPEAINVAAAIESIKTGVGVYSSISGVDFESRLRIVDALTNAEPLNENLGKPFKLANFVIQEVVLNDGTVAPRVILLDDEDKAFYAVSYGILSSIRAFVGVLGQPDTWPGPVTVMAEEVRTRSGYRVMSLRRAA